MSTQVRTSDDGVRAVKRFLYRAGQILVVLVVGYYITITVTDLVATDAFRMLRFDPVLIAASLLLLVVYNLTFVHSSQLVLRALGERVEFGAAFELTYVSALAKYVPGGVWHVVGRLSLARSLGVRKRSVVVVTVFENALGVVSGIIVAVAGLGAFASTALELPVWLAPLVAVASLALLHPAFMGKLMRFGLRMAHSDAEPPGLSFWMTLSLVLYRALAWFIAGAAFWLYARALVVGVGGDLVLYSGAYAAASVFGLLVLFVPGGIGVREAALTALLLPSLGPAAAGTIGLTSRLWSTVVELGLSFAAVTISARRMRLSGWREDT